MDLLTSWCNIYNIQPVLELIARYGHWIDQQ